MREELGSIYGENFVCYDSRIYDNNDDDCIMQDCYCNDYNDLDIMVYYGNNSRKIENIEERKCSLA